MPAWSRSLARGAALVLCVSVSACATTTAQQCAHTDWYQAGFDDGVVGQPAESFVQRWETCVAQGVKVDRERYVAGRNAGLEEYCTVSGGIDAGRSGRVYQNVCTEGAEEDFLSGYYMGALSPEP